MKHPTISRIERRSINGEKDRQSERGVTMVLIAMAIVAIMAMAALSIDVVTLYLANAESQRSADAAALAGARILSIYGVTSDPQDSSGYWATACAAAIQVAQNVANQNVVGGTVPSTVTVSFPQPCSGGGTAFGVNPEVQVQVQRSNLPTFFARIWGNHSATVSATATAEAFNPSGSAAYPAGMVSVQPRCVKPWLVANGSPTGYVNPTTGAITNPGIQLNYSTIGGVIGSQITLAPPAPGCTPLDCKGLEGSAALQQNQYVAANIADAPLPVAVASGATGDKWQEAIAGCDQTTAYACGTTGIVTADLTVNLGANNGDTVNATQALISSQDAIVTTTYPFEIRAGFSNPLFTGGIVNNNDVITSSNSVVTVPLFDNTVAFPKNQDTPNVTVVGFLQLFIQQVQNGANSGHITGTVLNVAGCGDGNPPASVTGSSPVPVRLISYP